MVDATFRERFNSPDLGLQGTLAPRAHQKEVQLVVFRKRVVVEVFSPARRWMDRLAVPFLGM